ncbi:MAG: 5'-nucleotidase [Granulosicoccus sp.]|jgi:5'-nucleotidase
MKRRSFIRNSAILGAGIGVLGSAGCNFIKGSGPRKLTILHTNDLHSRIDPFPLTDGKYAGLGGLSRIATLVEQERVAEKNVLLFDSGDIFQGTPYFNYYGGELEFKLMSQIGYDAATLGNHDFDNGVSGLVSQMPNASFPFLNSNYNLGDSELQKHVFPHKLFEIDGLRIGVFGIGIELEGLVNPNLYGKIGYLNPIKSANSVSNYLRNELKCNVVVCLSHLGYKYDSNKVSDITLAQQSENIDVILGGHTHTFLDQPEIVANNGHGKVMICQAGWAGIRLGKLSLFFDDDGKMVNGTHLA